MFESFTELLYKGLLGKLLEINPIGDEKIFFLLLALGYTAAIIIPYLLGSLNSA